VVKKHELDQNGAGLHRSVGGVGVDSMLAVGTAPWHYAHNADLVRLFEADARVRSAEVNAAAGIDWGVYQTPAFVYLGDHAALRVDASGHALNAVPSSFKLVGTQRKKDEAPVPDYYLNVRDDIDRVVGIVRKRYRVFQNLEAPRFLDNLVDSGDATYETAGSLHGGSQVWWLMKLPEGVSVAGDPREKLETYLLLTNSHDGSTSIVVAVVTIRVVCQNTLAWSLNKALRTMKVRHTESAKEQFMEARRSLDLGFTYQAELAEVADRMVHTAFSEGEFQTFLNSLVPTPKPIAKDGRVTNQRGMTMAQNTKASISRIYHDHPSQQAIAGTLWGAVQAVQFHSDHRTISRNTDDSTPEENRFKRLTTTANLGGEGFAKALARLKRGAVAGGLS
jgi:phage/plasmid-like protein (TIGR03299 family)